LRATVGDGFAICDGPEDVDVEGVDVEGADVEDVGLREVGAASVDAGADAGAAASAGAGAGAGDGSFVSAAWPAEATARTNEPMSALTGRSND